MVKIVIDYLISANLYLGYNLKFRNMSMLRYIGWVVKNVDILNLSFTLYNIRLVLNFLRKIYFNKNRVWLHFFIEEMPAKLVYLTYKWVKRLKKKLDKRLRREIYSVYLKYKRKRVKLNRKVERREEFRQWLLKSYFFKWQYGLLSNFKVLKKHVVKKIKFRLKFPQVVIFLSGICLRERYLPIINIADSSNNLRQNLYFVTANQKSWKSMLYFIRLFHKDYLICLRFKKKIFRKRIKYVLQKKRI